MQYSALELILYRQVGTCQLLLAEVDEEKIQGQAKQIFSWREMFISLLAMMAENVALCVNLYKYSNLTN